MPVMPSPVQSTPLLGKSVIERFRSHPTLQDDVAAALAGDHYLYVRNRLLAIQAVLEPFGLT